jgi:putative transcriptional regulator
MDEKLFAELVESVKEMKAIRRGDAKPSRVFDVKDPNAKAIRAKFGLSQAEFAALLGISVGTLRNWEQGARRPEGAARILLRVVEIHPQVVREASAPVRVSTDRPRRKRQTRTSPTPTRG